MESPGETPCFARSAKQTSIYLWCAPQSRTAILGLGYPNKRRGAEAPLRGRRCALFAVAAVAVVGIGRENYQATVDRVDRICFPGRCQSVPGRCGQHFLFCTPRKTNLDPLVRRETISTVPHCALTSEIIRRGPFGPLRDRRFSLFAVTAIPFIGIGWQNHQSTVDREGF